MVAGDTTRSRAYIQSLARNLMLPNYVLILDDSSGIISPGQLKTPELIHCDEIVDSGKENAFWSEAIFDPLLPIKETLDEYKVEYEVGASKDINHPNVVKLLRDRREQVFIYSGFGGALLRQDILSIGKKFLHVHGGYLPAYKGSTANYYSLIDVGKIGASAIFLNEKIDSGPILLRKEFPMPPNNYEIDHIYDSAARAKVLIETLRKNRDRVEWAFDESNNIGGETYFIIHPILKHIAIMQERF